MKKYLLAILLPAFFIVNIMCSKSNDVKPNGKVQTLSVLDSVGSCPICPSSGIFTPTSSAVNIGGFAASSAHYTKVGNEVSVDGRFSWGNATADGVTAFVNISVPAPFDFLTANLIGTFVLSQTTSVGVSTKVPYSMSYTSSGGGMAVLQFTVPLASKVGVLSYHYAYTASIVQ